MGHGGYYPDLFEFALASERGTRAPETAVDRKSQPFSGSGDDRGIPNASSTTTAPATPADSPDLRRGGWLPPRRGGCSSVVSPESLSEGTGCSSNRQEGGTVCSGKLDQFRAAEQERFAESAARWLALARATGIRIHGIGFKSNAVQADYLSDRSHSWHRKVEEPSGRPPQPPNSSSTSPPQERRSRVRPLSNWIARCRWESKRNGSSR